MASATNGDEMCPRYQRAVEILGKRWTAMIVRTLLSGPRRFGEMTEVITGLSDRLLSERLKELEACEIVERRVYSETPVRIEYVLTRKGSELEQVVQAIQHWADCWDETPRASAHRTKSTVATNNNHSTADQPAPRATNEPTAARSSVS